MSRWKDLQTGDVLEVRGKRSRVRKVVTVAEVLAPVAPDGRGFRGGDGEVYRFFYWDVAPMVAVPEGGPRRRRSGLA